MKKFLLSIFAVMLAVFSVQAQTYVFQKVTEEPTDWSGEYLIVCESQSVAFDGSMSTLDVTNKALSVTISNNKIAYDGLDKSIFTIAPKNGGGYTIKAFSGKYIGNSSSSKNQLLTATSYTNTLSFNSDASVNIVSSNTYLRFNKSSNEKRFRYFKASTYQGQEAISLYKKVEAIDGGDGGSTEPSEPETPVETVANPVISPYGVTFNEGETLKVTIETATEGADIYYTLDGTEPSANNGELYEGEIEITETTTVKAIAVKAGCNSSEVVTKTYTMKVTLGRLSVAEAIAAYDANNKADVTIVGYIVGVVDNNVNKFTGSTTVNTNLLIADNPNETNGENCIPVQLPSGTVRNELNLVDNSDIYKKKVALTGSLETYFKVAGLKEVSAYEFIPEYTLSVTDAGYATLFLDFAAAIPADVEAYTVTAVNNGYVTLTQVTGVLPANTGVIVKAAKNDYTFAYSTDEAADVTGNLLKGTVADKNIEGEAYVLGVVEGKVGLYKAAMTGTSWKNNANKAYLPMSAVANKSAEFFGFDWDGTTGIDEMTEQRAESQEIFDLTGRRVEAITAPGIYIVGGKKVLVK